MGITILAISRLLKRRVTRKEIIEAFKALPPDTITTTFRIAQRLGCTEHQVRGCISWLVLGGQLQKYEEVTDRKDAKERKYTASLYFFTGEEVIFRVCQDPTDRQIAKERRTTSAIDAFLAKPAVRA